jgi:hypothetical protein
MQYIYIIRYQIGERASRFYVFDLFDLFDL